MIEGITWLEETEPLRDEVVYSVLCLKEIYNKVVL